MLTEIASIKDTLSVVLYNMSIEKDMIIVI